MGISKSQVLEDIESLIEHFKITLHDPKHSNRAGQIYTLLKKLNKVLDKNNDRRKR